MEDLQKDSLENATQEIGNCGDFAAKMKKLASDVEITGTQLNSLGSQLAAVGKMLQQSELVGMLLVLNRINGEMRGVSEIEEAHEAGGHKEENAIFARLQKLCGVKKTPVKNDALSPRFEELEKKYNDERRKNEELREQFDNLNNEYAEKDEQLAKKIDELKKAKELISWLEKSTETLNNKNSALNNENEAIREDMTSLEAKLESQTTEIKELKAENVRLAEEMEQKQSLAKTLNVRIDGLNCDVQKLAAQLEARERDLQTAREQNAALDAQMPPNAPQLKEIAEKLGQIPPAFRELASGYYNIGQFPVFLSQTGQYGLLTQFWEGCFEKCRGGADPENIADFLRLLLELYNAANPGNLFSINFPKSGDMYDYKSQLRTGQNGQRVQRPLLPGLVKPNGEHAVKALVDVI